jgi:GAF domain-containing protein
VDNQELSASLTQAVRGCPAGSRSTDETLQTIVETVRISVPGMEHIGVSTVDRHGTVKMRAATGDRVWLFDELQFSLGEGPCVDIVRGSPIVEAPYIRHNRRWPRYVLQAVDMGLKAQLSIRLYLDDEGTVGGLNLYSTASEDIDSRTAGIADLFATHAALALGRTREIEHLREGLTIRETIGKAIGLVMARHRLSEGAAFVYLAQTSTHSGLTLSEVATRILERHRKEIDHRLTPEAEARDPAGAPHPPVRGASGLAFPICAGEEPQSR